MVEVGPGRAAMRWLTLLACALAVGACGEDNLIDWPLLRPEGKPLLERKEPWPRPSVPEVERPGTVPGDGPAVPALAVLAEGAAACPGAPVQLSAHVLGAVPPVELSWSPAEGLDDPAISRPVATGSVTTTYTVEVRDASGATARRSVVVERHGAPEARIGFVSGGPVMCAGAILDLDGSASTAGDGGALQFAWDLDGDGAVDRTDPGAGAFEPRTDGTARLQVTDGNGCTATASQGWEVRPIPVAVAGIDSGLCLGSSIALGGPAEPGVTYAWSPADGLDDPAVSDPVATPVVDTVYTVTASDAFGCASSDTVRIAVHPLPVADAGPDRTVARGGSVRLLGAASGGTPGYDFAWSPGAALDDPSSAQPLVTPDASRGYTLEVSDSNGCSDTDEVLVELRPGIHVDAGQDERLCLDGGGTVVLGASAAGGVGALQYAWTAEPPCGGCIADPASPATEVSPSRTTTFTVTVSDANGTTSSDAVVVEVLTSLPVSAGPDQRIQRGGVVQIGAAPVPGFTYEWTCDNWSCGISDPNVSAPWVAPEGNTAYKVTVSDGGTCTGSDTVLVSMDVRVLATVPVEGYSPWPRDALIWVIFDSDMDAASFAGNVVLWNPDTGLPLAITTRYDPATRTLEVDPITYPQNNRPAALQIRGGPTGVRSAAGDTMHSDFVLAYNASSMGDGAVPRTAWSTPLAGQAGVATTTDVLVQFDEPVDPQSVDANTFRLVGVAGTVSYDPRNWTAIFRPDQPLRPDTAYTLRVSGVRDGSDNAANWTLGFTTGSAPDLVPPVVVATRPAAFDAAFDVGTPLTVTFSEPIDPATSGGVRLIDLSTGYPVAAEAIYDDRTRTVTLDPRRLLEPQRQYRLDVSGVRDQGGNPMAARHAAPFTTTAVLFIERFESGAASWLLQQPWGIHWQATRAGAGGLADSPAGAYAPGASLTATAPPLDVSGRASVRLSFWNRRLLPADQDRLHVEYSRDRTAWTSAGALSGPSGWLPFAATIPTTGAGPLWIRLRLQSNASVQMDGVFIDELVVR